MGIDKIILIILAIFFAIGAIDRCIGHRIFLGKEFEKGFAIMGPTALTILGLICIAPVVATIIRPVVVPIYTFIGADPAMFSSTFLSPDCGGYSIAAELTYDQRLAKFGGLIVASTIGAVISFTVPLAYSLISKEDTKYFAVGIMSGFIFDPIACFFGGIAMGLSPKVVAINLIPVLFTALLIVFGLYFIPKAIIRAFQILSILLIIIITIGLIAGAVFHMTGLTLIPGIDPITDAFVLLGNVILVIAGAMPLLYTLRLALKRPISVISKKIGVNDITLVSLVISLTSIIPIYTEFKNMNPKGKVLAAAFTASMANMFGAHLGYISAIDPTIIAPMLLTKTFAGIFSIPTAFFFYAKLFGKKSKNPISENTDITK